MFSIDVDENEEEAFTLRVHHHGRFNEAKNEYIGGEVTYFDWVCIDFLSLLNLDVIAKDLGYRLPLSYYWKEYGENVFVEIITDMDTLDMVNFLPKDRVVDFYITEMVPIQVSFDDALNGTQGQESQFDSHIVDSDVEVEVLVGEQIPSSSRGQGWLRVFF